MSSSSSTPPFPLTPPNITTNNSSLGYYIAIALAFLILLSVILFSYVCYRSTLARRLRNQSQQHQNAHPDNGIYLPRIVFIAEDDEESINPESHAVGLDQSLINTYPRFVYSKKVGSRDFDDGNDVGCAGNETMCSICLCDYREAEMLRMLPECRHYFHVTCVDAWLKLNSSCPVCRNSPLPTPLSTPLSEVVPLSQYGDGRRRLELNSSPKCVTTFYFSVSVIVEFRTKLIIEFELMDLKD